jgi:SAM-dependent methyltransferase
VSLTTASSRDEHRVHVGRPEYYDVLSAVQFNLLTALGLREEHDVLDIGCGSLRAGRIFIAYLRPGRYFGIEPLPWLIEEGVRNEIGADMVAIKKPTFSHDGDFTLTTFGRTFDYMIAQSIFSHTSQAQMRRCLAEAKRCLKPGGIFAATFFEAPTNYEGDRWTPKAEYTLDRMRELVEEAGLECTSIHWRHPDPQQWILVHHPGTKARLVPGGEAERVLMLEEQLETNRQQLMKIRSHAYVRLGLKLQPLLIGLAFRWRAFTRMVRGAVGRGT